MLYAYLVSTPLGLTHALRVCSTPSFVSQTCGNYDFNYDRAKNLRPKRNIKTAMAHEVRLARLAHWPHRDAEHGSLFADDALRLRAEGGHGPGRAPPPLPTVLCASHPQPFSPNHPPFGAQKAVEECKYKM